MRQPGSRSQCDLTRDVHPAAASDRAPGRSRGRLALAPARDGIHCREKRHSNSARNHDQGTSSKRSHVAASDLPHRGDVAKIVAVQILYQDCRTKKSAFFLRCKYSTQRSGAEKPTLACACRPSLPALLAGGSFQALPLQCLDFRTRFHEIQLRLNPSRRDLGFRYG